MKHPWFHRFRKNRKEEAGQIPAEETTVPADADSEEEERAEQPAAESPQPSKRLSKAEEEEAYQALIQRFLEHSQPREKP